MKMKADLKELEQVWALFEGELCKYTAAEDKSTLASLRPKEMEIQIEQMKTEADLEELGQVWASSKES